MANISTAETLKDPNKFLWRIVDKGEGHEMRSFTGLGY